MSDSTDTTKLDTCGCCDPKMEEPSVENPPGQPALDYRISTHSAFLRRMIARLPKQTLPDGENAGQRPLTDLTTRAGDDPAIALLDAWAIVGEILSFYQERIANEGYVRTATERRSVLELARAIGYELSPGVAAETYLAFTLDNAESSPDEATISAGTQVQSIPAKEGELPQTFETAQDFDAKVWWNKLHPQLTRPQTITLSAKTIYLKGTNLNLTPGDRMLLVQKDSAGNVQKTARKRVRTVETDSDHDHTLVTFESENSAGIASSRPFAKKASESVKVSAIESQIQRQSMQPISPGFGAVFNAANVDSLLKADLTESQFQAVLNMSRWEVKDVLDYASVKPVPAGTGEVQVFALREEAGIFGNNAPHYMTLSQEVRGAFHNWDDPGWEIWKDSVKGSAASITLKKPEALAATMVAEEFKPSGSSTVSYYQDADLYLERPILGIVEDSWLVLERPGAYKAFKVDKATEASLAGFGISAKVTGLELADKSGNPLGDNATDKDPGFKVRKTTAYVKSEELELASLPVTDDLEAGDTDLTLDALVLGLQEDQPVALTGEQADAEGVERSEIKILDAITHSGGYTRLKFSEGLKYSYKRDTVTINANVVPATHGETVSDEALGSGDGSRTNQSFKLRKPPLTYLSAATASGTKSTLCLRVNGVEWQEVSSMYGLDGDARSYIVRINDDGEAIVVFGDGKSGARLPTGQENVVATYRSGIGSDGEVVAGSLTLMKTRPFGVSSVTNPTDASGADDPEGLDNARDNAPLTVLTLDRIVSLQDFEAFTRAFAGIGKAQAVSLWNGETELVYITVADANGDEVASTSDLYKNLRDAINSARDPLRSVEIGSFQPRYFDVDARVLIDPAYEWEDVKSEIESVLVDRFSFNERAFGQPVTAAEAVNIIHDIEGVVAVDLERLYVVGETGEPVGALLSSVLPARTARPNPEPTGAIPQKILQAELLLINESGITLTEMASS
jgi:predicted phage baseplate assembly protein